MRPSVLRLSCLHLHSRPDPLRLRDLKPAALTLPHFLHHHLSQTMTAYHPSIKAGNVGLITGAGLGGIGYSCASTLLSAGMTLVLVDNSPSALSLAQSSLVAGGVPASRIHVREVDVASSEAVFALAKEVFESFGKIDFLMLNAGVQIPSLSFAGGERGDMDSWEKIMGVNFGGVLNGTQAFVHRMVEQGTPGAVVITGSKQVSRPSTQPFLLSF